MPPPILNTSAEEFPIHHDAVARDLSPPKVCQSTSAPLTCAVTFNLMPQRDRRIQEALEKNDGVSRLFLDLCDTYKLL